MPMHPSGKVYKYVQTHKYLCILAEVLLMLFLFGIIHLNLSLFLSTLEVRTETEQKHERNGGIRNIEISSKTLTRVPYAGVNLDVWPHIRNEAKPLSERAYFVMPVVLLLPEYADCRYSPLSERHLLRLKILMWSEDVVNAVLLHLRLVTGDQELKTFQIHALPLEKVRLVWYSTDQPLAAKYQTDRAWKPNTKLSNSLQFWISTKEEEHCRLLEEEMKRDPNLFDRLELEYVIHAQSSSSKRITIKGEHLLSGTLFAKLKGSAKNSGYAYLSSNDLQRLSREVLSTVVSSAITDNSYVDTGDELSSVKLLSKQLSAQKILSTEFSPQVWESVFWEPTFARPDKVANYLNEVFSKDQGKIGSLNVNENQLQEGRGGLDVSVVKWLNIGLTGKGGEKKKTSVKSEEMNNWLKENNYQVEWTHEVFRPKRLDLHRLNVVQFSSNSVIASTAVQVHKMEMIHKTKVTIPSEELNVTWELSRHTNTRLDMMGKQLQLDRNATEDAVQELTMAIETESDERKGINYRFC